MVQIYLSPDLAEMVRQVQAGAGWSNAELVLSAIQATYQELEGVIAAESAIPTGGLFSREYRPRRGTGSATVQFGIRLLQDDIADKVTTMLAGATESVLYRPLGIAAYGFTPLLTTSAEIATAHGDDERIQEATVRRSVGVFYDVVREISSGR